MSRVKGVVNRNSKTSGKNSATNTALQNADSKNAVPNKTHKQEKFQESCLTIGKKKKSQARSVKKKEKDDLTKTGKVDGDAEWDKIITQADSITIQDKGLMMTSGKLTKEIQQKKVAIQPPAATTLNSHHPEFVSSPFEENSMEHGKKQTLRARIPPHSKIPLCAVEMPPDDSNANIHLLDVSFGAFDLSCKVPQLCDPSQEQNSLTPVIKHDDSIAQKVDSILTHTQYSTISNQSSVQTQRSLKVNQVPQSSIKMLSPRHVPPSADYLTKQSSAVANPYENINTGQPTPMHNSSVYYKNPQDLSSHTSLYGTTASNIGLNSTSSHIPQLSQFNYSNLNVNYPQTGAQHQFPSFSYPNTYSYQASGISYLQNVSDANLASMYTTSTNSNYIYQNLHETGNTNLSRSSVLSTSTTNSTKESLYYQSQPSNNSWTTSVSNPNGNNISDTTSSIGLKQRTLLTSRCTTPTTNNSGVLSGMPPGVVPLVDAQYTSNQQCIPGYYSQSPSEMYSEEYLQMVQSGSPHHNMTNIYSTNPMYPGVSSILTGSETAGTGISNIAGYSSLTDSRYARTDNNASPVSSILSQQTQTLAHQRILLNPIIAPSYTYYYGQLIIPANPFQRDTMYLMVPAASTTSYGIETINTMSWNSNTAASPADYNNVYETLGSSSVTGSSNDYENSIKMGMSDQQSTQPQGKTNLSNLTTEYPNKSTLNNQSFQSTLPYSVTNNCGVGVHQSAGSYPPVLISPMPSGNLQTHHIAPFDNQIDIRVQKKQRMVPAASTTSYDIETINTMSGNSNTAASPADYNNVYETLGSSSVTGSSNDYENSIKMGMSDQQSTQPQGKTNLSNLTAEYPNKSTLNNQSFQSTLPYSVTNNCGVGVHQSAGSYPPVLISPMPSGNLQTHHIAPLDNQIDIRVQKKQRQKHSSGKDNLSRNRSVNPTANKAEVKQNYSQDAGGTNKIYLR